MKETGGQETAQKTEPWGEAQPALKDILGQSHQLYNLGLGDLSTRSNSDLYGQSTGALGQMFSGTGPLSNLSATANGDYLNNNPHLSEMFSALSGDVTDAVNSQMSMAGRTGDPIHYSQMTKELGKLGAGIYGQDYARERQNQLGAGQTLGSFMGSALQATPGVYDFGNADLDAAWKNLSRYSDIGRGIGSLGNSFDDPNASSSNSQQSLGALASLAGTAISLFSDRNAKTDIREADEDAVLEAITQMPVFTYRYKAGVGDDGAEPRIGPMAQDWAGSFGGNGNTIPMPQIIGAMMTAIKALGRKMQRMELSYGAR